MDCRWKVIINVGGGNIPKERTLLLAYSGLLQEIEPVVLLVQSRQNHL